MTENERVRELRKARGMTQEEFCSRVGVTRAAIANIEKGNRSVTDQMRRSICREFGVREEWLRDGTGAMVDADARAADIEEAVNRLMSGETAEFKRRFIVALSALDESQWVFLLEKMREIVGVDGEPEPDEEAEALELARQIMEDKKAEGASPASSFAAGASGA